MPPDVSVIMPAYRAADTIVRAAGSALAQAGVHVELVVCADDDADYGALLSGEVRGRGELTLCRTPRSRSGPSAARNLALQHARGEVIACLDADDTYAPDRLRWLLPMVERHGVATGPTREIAGDGSLVRLARPRAEAGRLPIEDICELRMPFSPVFHRRLGASWPPIAFAEDVILNVDLFCAAGGAYPFVAEAEYIYHAGAHSRSEGPEALLDAREGYLQILDLAQRKPWPGPVRDLVTRVFQEDLANVERALAGEASTSWRQAVRDGARD